MELNTIETGISREDTDVEEGSTIPRTSVNRVRSDHQSPHPPSAAIEHTFQWPGTSTSVGPKGLGPASIVSGAQEEETTPDVTVQSASLSEAITFTRKGNHYRPVIQNTLKNSVLASIGFMELANAGDFPANFWNVVPIPHYAMALMALGGTMALAMSCITAVDACLSWRNIKILRKERCYIRSETNKHKGNRLNSRLGCLLDLNTRELGTELFDRFTMDVLLGFGLLLVGIGTLMAIGGANRKVFEASNLLSGYIGNTPSALYGLVNALWAGYMWRRIQRQHAASIQLLDDDLVVKQRVKARLDTMKTHCIIAAMTVSVAGAASMIAATMRWGYIMLIPCIFSSAINNYIWRRWIGYDRPFIAKFTSSHMDMDKSSIIQELKFVLFAQRILKDKPASILSKLVARPESVQAVIEFITKYDLFEQFCLSILKDRDVSVPLFGALTERITIESEYVARCHQRGPQLLRIAHGCLNMHGLKRFEYRERYLIELLCCHLTAEMMVMMETIATRGTVKDNPE